MQYARKVSETTQSSVVDVHFGFTRSVSISQILMKILISGVEGGLVMRRQLIEDLGLRSNLLMESSM